MASDKSCDISAAKQLLAAAKTQELTVLQIVKSQRAMLEIMKKNMRVAQSQLESSQLDVKEAEKLLKEAEKRCDTMMVDVDSDVGTGLKYQLKVSSASDEVGSCGNTKNNADIGLGRNMNVISHVERTVNSKDNRRGPTTTTFVEMKNRMESAMVEYSPTQVHTHPSITQAPQFALPYIDQARWPSSLPSVTQAPKPSQDPQVKSQLFNLGQEAKMILREVVLSAILHPSGKVDPGMLERAMREGGMSKQAVMNAVEVARMRHMRKNREATKTRLGISENRLGKNDKIIRRANNDCSSGTGRAGDSGRLSNGHDKNDSIVRQTNCKDAIIQKKTLPKAA